uniref:Uncharacterized protein n=1 Tax=Rhizophora mucronata TaxID=61149 RepID=A0A2P2JK90_RHIMU
MGGKSFFSLFFVIFLVMLFSMGLAIQNGDSSVDYKPDSVSRRELRPSILVCPPESRQGGTAAYCPPRRQDELP